MKPVDIDFAPASPVRALLRARHWQLLVLLAAFAAFISGLLALHQRTPVRLTPPADRVQKGADKLLPLKPTLARTTAVNQAIQQLNLPWQELRSALAGASEPSIALMAIEPDAAMGTLKISAESRSSAEMFHYIDRLKQQKFFRTVELRNHELQEQSLRFQLEVGWGRP